MARFNGHGLPGWKGEAALGAWLTGVALLLVGCFAPTQSGPQTPRETALDSVIHIEFRELSVPDVPRLDDSLSLQSQRVDVGAGVHLYVVEEGLGLSLVLVNGGPGNTLHSFLPHFSAAATFARVIYYDISAGPVDQTGYRVLLGTRQLKSWTIWRVSESHWASTAGLSWDTPTEGLLHNGMPCATRSVSGA